MAEAPGSRTYGSRRNSLSRLACHGACHVFSAAAILLPAPAAAQTPPLLVMKTIQTLQRQVDVLQRRLDGLETFSRATIDWAILGPGVALVQGWGFACGQPDGGRLVIVVDGVQSVQATPAQFFRVPRPDVDNAPNAQLCRLVGAEVPTATAGFQTLLDLTPFEPGERGDHRHTVKVRIYDQYGRMRESEPMLITALGSAGR